MRNKRGQKQAGGRGTRGLKKAFNSNSTRAVFCGIITLILLGVIAGAVYAVLMDNADYETVKSCITGFFDTFDKNNINVRSTLLDSVYKYARIIVVIWISGLFVPGIVIILCIILFKSFAYGFTTAALIKYFGFYGFVVGFSSYIPQNLFFLPALIFVSCNAVISIYTNISSAGGKSIERSFTEYFIVFLTGLLCCVCAALTETYLTPVFIEYVKPV